MSTTTLKILALLLMLIDHIGEFIPGTPLWLRYIGRLSAPIFFFCMVWGLHYTHNKKKYLTRLYICNIIMTSINYILPILLKNDSEIHNNIFLTMLVAGIFISSIEYIIKNPLKLKKVISILISWQLFDIVLIIIIESIFNLSFASISIINCILGSVALVEGQGIMVLLIIILYFCKNSCKKLILGYSLFCIAYIGIVVLDFTQRVFARLEFHINSKLPFDLIQFVRIPFKAFGLETIFFSGSLYESFFITNYQWMMLFSLPFMLMYNEKKGRGFKYFFYIFYPLHIYILYIIGTSMV